MRGDQPVPTMPSESLLVVYDHSPHSGKFLSDHLCYCKV